MINETLQASALLVNGSIPLSVTLNSSSNWTQFAISIVIGLIGTFGVLIFIFLPKILSKFGINELSRLAKASRRNMVLIKHTNRGMFSASMIDESSLRDMSKVMNKMEGESFDLILHTPGGDIFSSLAISRLIKQYPGPIRAIIPLYSMSGGSLLALSCEEIIMTPNASMGPIDPQLGSFFKFGSAKTWNDIVKIKG